MFTFEFKSESEESDSNCGRCKAAVADCKPNLLWMVQDDLVLEPVWTALDLLGEKGREHPRC